MPKRTDIFSSILVIGAGLALHGYAAAEKPGIVRPPQYQVDGWVSSCWPGTDGFAVECEARKFLGDYVLRLSVADSQLYLIVEHPRCQSGDRNIFREDLIALGHQGRRSWIARNFDQIARSLRKACPKLSPLDRRVIAKAPDIAMAGDEVLR